MTVYENYDVIAFKSCIQISTVRLKLEKNLFEPWIKTILLPYINLMALDSLE